MQLHSKQWFLITCHSMLSDYTQDDLECLWETFSTAQLDFLQDMCQTSYNAGYKAAGEDRM